MITSKTCALFCIGLGLKHAMIYLIAITLMVSGQLLPVSFRPLSHFPF
jgi:hypothetical protein